MDLTPGKQRQADGLALATALGLLLLASVNPQKIYAQTADRIPGTPYFLGIDEFYSGELRDAQRMFRREANRGIKIGTSTRWIDSICYHAMLGELFYQIGNNADALTQFDQACQLFLQYPNWLLRVKFQQPPQPDVNRSRREQPPWGRSERQFTLGDFPPTMLVFYGRMPSAEEIRRRPITVVEAPQFWRLNITETVRCTALAIRRRNEILGPLGKYDRLSKELADTLARGNLAPPNHWSTAWIELLLGLAQVGVGNVQEAHTHLSRGLIADGRYDHPMTGVVLLEQGRLALDAGDLPAAARLLAEASFSAFYYEDWNVLDESLRLGNATHLMAGGPGVYPPLEAAANWARREGLRMLSTNFRRAQAENLALLGEPAAAAAALEDASRWLGEMSAGRPGIDHLYVKALLNYGQQRHETAEDALGQAINRQMAASVKNFQIHRTNRLFDGSEGGQISSRVAVGLYEQLLADPVAKDWAHGPLDTLAVLKTPHNDAFDRWFMAALERKEILQALEIAEQAKRRQFFASLPWGGRLLALRMLLGDQAADLPAELALMRQQALMAAPGYKQLLAEAVDVRRQLDQQPLIEQNQADRVELADRYEKWAKNAAVRETLLREIGLRRQPSPLAFPPLRTAAQLQQSLKPGQVVALFHTVAGRLYGFLLTGNDYHAWQLGRSQDLQQSIAELLREFGNFGAGRTITQQELSDDGWRKSAHGVWKRLFAESRLVVDQTTELIIVPDGVLWYLPFEALVPTLDQGSEVLAHQVLIRYAPTAGLAVADTQPFRRVQHSGIVASNLNPQAVETFGPSLDRLADTVPGAVRLTLPLPVPARLAAARLDQLISFDEIVPRSEKPYDWSLLPRDRGRPSNRMSDLLGLPQGGPERVVLAGFATAAENGLKGVGRRGDARQQSPGSEVFRSTCALMACGARTVLLTRWRSGGQTNLELVREFVQESPHLPAAEAWQRCMLLARDTPLDAGREPRMKPPDDLTDLPTASHPFFWAGYLLVDTGFDPSAERHQPAEEQPVVKFKENSKKKTE